MEKITFVFTLSEGKILATCPEVDCSGVGVDMESALEVLMKNLPLKVANLYSDVSSLQSVSPLFLQLFAQGDLREWPSWTRKVKAEKFREDSEMAFTKAYPQAARACTDSFGYCFVYSRMPSISWDGSKDNNVTYEKDMARQALAYEGLIKEGPTNQNWIEFVYWLSVVDCGRCFYSGEKIPSSDELMKYFPRYKEWYKWGLPVCPPSDLPEEIRKKYKDLKN